MNIQIFGKSKCFDTKKAERYFKERRIKYQYIDLNRYGISRGELQSVKNAVGLEDLIDEKHPDAALLRYLARADDKLRAHSGRPHAFENARCPQRKTGHRRVLPGRVEAMGIKPYAPGKNRGHIFFKMIWQ